MNIVVTFQSGKVREFNSNTYLSHDPFVDEGQGGKCLLSEFTLRLDKFPEDGLVLEVYWYNSIIDAQTEFIRDQDGNQTPVAGLQKARFFKLIRAEETQDILKVDVDGQSAILWDQGEFLNTMKFQAQNALYYSDEVTSSFADRAVTLYQEIQQAYPHMSVEDIAKHMGYPTHRLIQTLDRLNQASQTSEAQDDKNEE